MSQYDTDNINIPRYETDDPAGSAIVSDPLRPQNTYNTIMFYRGNSHPRLFSIPDKMKKYDFHPVPRITEDSEAPIAPGLPLFDYIPQEQASPAVPRQDRPLVTYVQPGGQQENGPIVQYICNRNGSSSSDHAAPPRHPASTDPIQEITTPPSNDCNCAKCVRRRHCRPRRRRDEEEEHDQEEADQEEEQPNRLQPTRMAAQQYGNGFMAMSPFDTPFASILTTPPSGQQIQSTQSTQPTNPTIPANYPTFSSDFKPAATTESNTSPTIGSGFQGVDNAYSSSITGKYGGSIGGIGSVTRSLGNQDSLSQILGFLQQNQRQQGQQDQGQGPVSAQQKEQVPQQIPNMMNNPMALQQQMMMQQYQMQISNLQKKLQQPNVQSQPQVQYIIQEQIKQIDENIKNIVKSTPTPTVTPQITQSGQNKLQTLQPTYSSQIQTTPPFVPVAIAVLNGAAKPGDIILNLPTPPGCQVGMDVVVGEGSTAEKFTVIGMGSIILDKPLVNSHPIGSTVKLYTAGGAPPISTVPPITNLPIQDTYVTTMPNIYYTTPATTISYKTTKPYETTPVVTTIPYTTTPVVTTRVATTTPVATTRAVSFRDGMVVYYTFDSDNFDLTNNKIKNKVTNTFDAGVDGGGNSSTNPKIGNGCFDLAGRVIWFDTGVKYGTNGFTISFWFKGSFDSMGMNGNQSCLYGSSTADITTDANLFTIFMNCNANNAAVSSNYDKGKMAVFYNNSAGRAGDIGTTGYKYKFDSGMVSFPKDTWTHFALTVTYDSGTNALYTMYFNGNPVNTMRGAYPLDAPAASIGRQANGGGWRSGPGAFMDNFAIHNRVLTPSQITALYNMTTNII